MAAYTIKTGDTLTAIARKLSGAPAGSTELWGALQALISINQIKDPDKIYAGQILSYPDDWIAPPNARQSPGVEPASSGPAPGVSPGFALFSSPWFYIAAAVAVFLFFSRSK